MDKSLCLALIFIATLWQCAHARSDERSAVDIYQAAVKTAKQGKLHQARRLFSQAEISGYKLENVHYNLGVINYRLGFYPSAKSSFLKLTQSENFKHLAYYNLALTEAKLENKSEAIYWLDKCSNSSTINPQLQALAASLKSKLSNDSPFEQKNELRNHSLRKASISLNDLRRPRIRTFVNTEMGYNDNVGLYNYSSPINQENPGDNFIYLIADARLQLSPTINFGTVASHYGYQTKSHYDLTELSTFIRYSNKKNMWRYYVSTTANKQNLDNEDFQLIGQFSGGVQRQMFNRIRTNLEYEFYYYHLQNEAYRYLNGTEQIIRNKWTFYSRLADIGLVYQYAHNQREDFFFNETFHTSFSPRTQTLSLNVKKHKQRNFAGEIYLTVGYSYYPDGDRISHTSAAVPAYYLNRQDVFLKYGFSFAYFLKSNLQLVGSFDNLTNESNINRFLYENNLYQAGIRFKY